MLLLDGASLSARFQWIGAAPWRLICTPLGRHTINNMTVGRTPLPILEELHSFFPHFHAPSSMRSLSDDASSDCDATPLGLSMVRYPLPG